MKLFRSLRTGAAAFALLLAGPGLSPSPATPGGGWTFPGARGLAAQEEARLLNTARGLARAWAGGADRAVAAQLARGQIRLHLGGQIAATLPNRQATAILRDYLRGYHPGEVEVIRVTVVDGAGDRGFVELRWTARRAGTSQRLQRTVFLGFRQEGRNWTVEEIRVLR